MKQRARAFTGYILHHSIAQKGFIVFAGMMAVNVSSYLYHLAVGRILGPEDYSIVAALFSILYILNVFTEVLRSTLVKFFSMLRAKNQGAQAKYLYLWSNSRIAVFVVLCGVVLIPLAPQIARFLHIDQWMYVLFLYGIAAPMFLSTISASVMYAYQKFTVAMILSNVGGLLRLITGVFFALFGIGWTLLGNILTNVVQLALYVVYALRLLPRESEKVDVTKKNAVHYSVPVFLATLGIGVIYSQDVILVKHFFPSFEAGIYSSLSVLGKIIFFATSALVLVIFPIISERRELGVSINKIVFASGFLVLVLSFGITGVYFLFPELVVLALFGSEYLMAADNVGFFGVFLSLFSFSNLIVNICLAAGYTGVWLMTLLAAGSQLLLISVFHTSIFEVILINVCVAAVLSLSVVAYYAYANKNS